MPNTRQWSEQLKLILQQFEAQVSLKPGHILAVGCSTSEVAGKRIGTAGTLETAEAIFHELRSFAATKGIRLAFQCCEHLNRALVVERETMEEKGLEEVSVIPVRTAGGAMAAWAYDHMENPAVVEHIQADAGIDIGETMIGMHIKHVAVPVRIEQKWLGDARVVLASSRPKLIGGPRAVYEKPEDNGCTAG